MLQPVLYFFVCEHKHLIACKSPYGFIAKSYALRLSLRQSSRRVALNLYSF